MNSFWMGMKPIDFSLAVAKEVRGVKDETYNL